MHCLLISLCYPYVDVDGHVTLQRVRRRSFHPHCFASSCWIHRGLHAPVNGDGGACTHPAPMQSARSTPRRRNAPGQCCSSSTLLAAMTVSIPEVCLATTVGTAQGAHLDTARALGSGSSISHVWVPRLGLRRQDRAWVHFLERQPPLGRHPADSRVGRPEWAVPTASAALAILALHILTVTCRRLGAHRAKCCRLYRPGVCI